MGRVPVLAMIVLLCCAAVGAWQDAMTTLGLTQKQLEESFTYFRAAAVDQRGEMAAKAMTPEQRVSVVREIGGAIKTLVSSAAFQKTYAEYIKTKYDAVDHGLKQASGAVNMSDTDRIRQGAAVQMAMMIRMFPFEAAKNSICREARELGRDDQGQGCGSGGPGTGAEDAGASEDSRSPE